MPGLHNRFAENQPFHALILLDSISKEGKSIHDLVREAEGPRHNELLLKNMKGENRKKLQEALKEIGNWIANQVPAFDAETYRPDDILVIGEYGVESGGSRPGFPGQPTVIRRRPQRRGGQMKKKQKDPSKGASLKAQQIDPNPMDFRASAVQTGPRSCRINVKPEENYEDSRIRLPLDINLDPTCEGRENESYLILKKAKVNGKAVPKGNMELNEEGNPVGVLLGSMKQGEPRLVEAEYETPGKMNIPKDRKVVFQVELLGNKPKAQKESKETQ